MGRHVARDISYSHSAETRGGRALIRTLENATGRLKLIRRAEGYEDEVARGADFWQVMVQRYGLSLNVTGGSISNLPTEGPLVVVSNHPYGILDGLTIGHILSSLRGGDFRILANSVFKKADELNRVLLPISFGTTREAIAENLQTRKDALSYLAGGGAIGVFPGGTVSTSAKPFSRPMDPAWRSFTAKMISKSGATVVPIFFEGCNSRLFQIASHLHQTLRLALLIKEFKRRTDDPVNLVIGDPIPAAELDVYRSDQKAMMDFLRARTYALSPKRLEPIYGFEFEEKHKRASTDGGRNI
ncbi:lysophospholipid acyltransferase family protein [Rhodobacteraceae bacterium]|nr:lysophospholipid acyltransferase family protein [Paracoccaceae bacterium]